jgi:uncharacterized protein (UPF0262 family)
VAAGEEDDRGRIVQVHLEEVPRLRFSATIDHERRQALYDLIQANCFALKNGAEGPYVVHLSLEDGGILRFVVCDAAEEEMARFAVPLASLRRIIKDYFLVCDSYVNAIKTMPPSRIEAIDMGRRGLHNEGAALLRDKLSDRVEMDEDTARRLFTLICVLHIRS